ncbi:MAG: ABC transporter permease subunit [Deltaproteobacteria bacterium]|nr:ABC transporter permease subunit [Deltaproteobacteria bacterium]
MVILRIAAKEIRSSFVTPLVYIICAGFLVVSGFFFFSLLQQFNAVLAQASMMRNISPNLNEWVIIPYYQTLEVILLFLIPILTMRSLAEEKKNGTFELLMTSPISVAQLVWGKLLGTAVIVVLMLLTSFTYSLLLIIFSDPEVLPVLIGFLGVVLFAIAFTFLGVAVSAFTSSQVISGVVSLILLLLFYVVDAPATKLPTVIGEFLRYLAPTSHTVGFLKGVLSSIDVIYFLSLMLVGAFIANRALDAQRWRQ